jgi:hypothetical protein
MTYQWNLTHCCPTYSISLALSLWDAYKDVGGSATQDAKAERE